MAGMGTSSGTQSQQTQQQSQSNPWAPAQPELQSILADIGGVNPGVSGYQQGALSQGMNNASGLQNFTGQATNAANSFLGGDPTGLLGPAYQQYQNQVNPIANASLNPMQTPGFSNALGTVNNDITNQVNGEFAGAGRSGSGLNTQQLARGLGQGEGQMISNQYNQNVSNTQGAANGLLGAGMGTAGAMNQATGQGLGMASTVPGFAAQTPNAMLSAANQNYMLPLQQMGALENLTVPIAGLGGQTSGSSNSQGQTTQTMSPIQMMMALMGGGANSTMSGMGALGQTGLSGLKSLGNGIGNLMIPPFVP